MHRRQAFTLIELLVVISIIALLISILLPSLAAARYQAKVIKCKATLRGIALAQVTYSYDNKSYFIAASPDYEGPGIGGWDDARDFGAQFRSWALTEQGINVRPLYKQYIGAPLQKAMVCPLATSYFNAQNLDQNIDSNVGRRLTPYMVYSVNNARLKHFYFKERGYKKMDTDWAVDPLPDVRFTLIASDFVFGSYSVFGSGDPAGLMTTHPSPGGSVGNYGGPLNDQIGWRVETPQSVPLNYVDADMSVRTFTADNDSKNDSDNWVKNNCHRGKDFLIPKGLAR